jgi:mannose-1-phosphate guanylyltransferase
MQALVLVGGEGTRLRPLTLTRPKPALTLVDRPFIRFMVDWLARHGVDEVVMACGFRAEDLRSALGDEVPGEARILYVEEDEPLGTAGPVRLAADRGLLGERFMVLNGDLLTDLDLTALQATHAERDAVATLALYPVDDPSAYGLVRRADDDEVLGFIEKPDPGDIDTNEVNAGAYVLERGVLDLIPPGRAVSIEREVFPRLVGQGLYGRRLDGYWMDIGTPERYLKASWDILEGRVKTDVSTRADGVLVEADAAVADGASVGPRAVVRSGCRIGAGAAVAESVLFDDCRLGDGAEVRGAILARGVEIGERARVSAGSVIGEGARIAPGVTLGDDSRVDPEEVVGA